MFEFTKIVASIATLAMTMPHRVDALSNTLMDMLAGRETTACPRYQQIPRDPCNIVVK